MNADTRSRFCIYMRPTTVDGFPCVHGSLIHSETGRILDEVELQVDYFASYVEDYWGALPLSGNTRKSLVHYGPRWEADHLHKTVMRGLPVCPECGEAGHILPVEPGIVECRVCLRSIATDGV